MKISCEKGLFLYRAWGTVKVKTSEAASEFGGYFYVDESLRDELVLEGWYIGDATEKARRYQRQHGAAARAKTPEAAIEKVRLKLCRAREVDKAVIARREERGSQIVTKEFAESDCPNADR